MCGWDRHCAGAASQTHTKALKIVVNIVPIEKDEYARAFELMHTNMIVYHTEHNIPCE
jgi:hypothetical protein